MQDCNLQVKYLPIAPIPRKNAGTGDALAPSHRTMSDTVVITALSENLQVRLITSPGNLHAKNKPPWISQSIT